VGAYPGVVAVAEPTSMTWLGLSIALRGARHAARLRGAIIGKDKSDVIDADVLATAGEVFTSMTSFPRRTTARRNARSVGVGGCSGVNGPSSRCRARHTAGEPLP